MLRRRVVQQFDLIADKTDGHNDEQDRHLIKQSHRFSQGLNGKPSLLSGK
jgi:hypothetical protein